MCIAVKLPTCDQARIYYEKNKLYSVLGVDTKATEDVIKRHFRKMSILCMVAYPCLNAWPFITPCATYLIGVIDVCWQSPIPLLSGHPDKDQDNPKSDENFIAIAGGMMLCVEGILY